MGSAPVTHGAHLEQHQVAHSGLAASTDGSSASGDLDPIAQDALRAELTAARRGIPGRTVGSALAQGYEFSETPEFAGAVHLHRGDAASLDLAQFDPATPVMVLAEGRRSSDRLLAAVYWIEDEAGDHPPEGFTGSLDVWHRHRVVCEVADRIETGDRNPDLTVASCEADSGRVLTVGAWMLHAWVIDGIPGPNGDIFDSDH